jgi:hypothetical protein
MAERPLVVLPSGHLIFASDIPRFRFGKKLRALVEFVVFTAILLVVIFGAALVDPVHP